MHSYGGPKDFTKSYLKLNANIFFSLSLGWMNRNDIAENIPIENLIIETDSPY